MTPADIEQVKLEMKDSKLFRSIKQMDDFVEAIQDLERVKWQTALQNLIKKVDSTFEPLVSVPMVQLIGIEFKELMKK